MAATHAALGVQPPPPPPPLPCPMSAAASQEARQLRVSISPRSSCTLHCFSPTRGRLQVGPAATSEPSPAERAGQPRRPCPQWWPERPRSSACRGAAGAVKSARPFDRLAAQLLIARNRFISLAGRARRRWRARPMSRLTRRPSPPPPPLCRRNRRCWRRASTCACPSALTACRLRCDRMRIQVEVGMVGRRLRRRAPQAFDAFAP